MDREDQVFYFSIDHLFSDSIRPNYSIAATLTAITSIPLITSNLDSPVLYVTQIIFFYFRYIIKTSVIRKFSKNDLNPQILTLFLTLSEMGSLNLQICEGSMMALVITLLFLLQW